MTVTAVRLIDSVGEALKAEWHPPDGKNINVVAANNRQAVCACGKTVYYLELGDGAITQVRFVCGFAT